jgi:DNA polymerase
MSPDVSQAQAARALLAFWRAAGVDMDEAEAVYAAAPAKANPGPPASSRQTARAGRMPAVQAPLDAAKAAASGAMSIPELRAAVEAFNGCGLKTTARTTVFTDGAESARVLLLGEAPGKEEDEQGKPFVGRSGQLLDRMMAAIGLDRRTNILISNTIFWRPPGDRTPTQGEIAACLPFAERLVALAKPDLLILTGGAAAQTMLKREETVSKMRGRRLAYAREGMELPPVVNAVVMLHPSYLLRRPQEKRQAWNDLLLLGAWLDELGVARAPRV